VDIELKVSKNQIRKVNIFILMISSFKLILSIYLISIYPHALALIFIIIALVGCVLYIPIPDYRGEKGLMKNIFRYVWVSGLLSGIKNLLIFLVITVGITWNDNEDFEEFSDLITLNFPKLLFWALLINSILILCVVKYMYRDDKKKYEVKREQEDTKSYEVERDEREQKWKEDVEKKEMSLSEKVITPLPEILEALFTGIFQSEEVTFKNPISDQYDTKREYYNAKELVAYFFRNNYEFKQTVENLGDLPLKQIMQLFQRKSGSSKFVYENEKYFHQSLIYVLGPIIEALADQDVKHKYEEFIKRNLPKHKPKWGFEALRLKPPPSVKGEKIVFNNGAKFVDDLDEEFEDWYQKEEDGSGKKI
jgi:cbb3-type cytochrome oxidase subunit 3